MPSNRDQQTNQQKQKQFQQHFHTVAGFSQATTVQNFVVVLSHMWPNKVEVKLIISPSQAPGSL